MRALSRRTLIGAATAGLVLSQRSHAQTGFGGRIAFVQDGNIMQWSPEGTTELHRDGNAMSPTWRPGEDMLLYVRSGGSFSNLITLDTETGRTRRLTDNESGLQPGSAEYVEDCVWISDAFWSESDIVCFPSNAEDPYGWMDLWVLRYTTDYMFPGPSDETEPGQIEKVTVDADGRYAAYTVTGETMTSYIGMRDLDTGETWPVIEGAHGAYDGAVSPDGDWVIGTIRDSDGRNDLWLCKVESGETVRLTEGEEASCVTWNPEGDAVAYLAYVGDGFSLRAFSIDFWGDEPSMIDSPQVMIEKAAIDSTSRLSWNT